MKRPRTWVLLIALLAAALPLVMPWLLAPPPQLLVRQALFGATVDDAALRPVALPHRWAAERTDCPDCRSAWYRVDLALPAPARGAQAILLTDAAHNAALYLNGELLAQGGRFSDPVARLGGRPLWAVVPAQAWQAGENRLYVLVKAEPARAGRLGALAVGAEEDLVRLWRARVLWVEALPQLAATAAAILAVVMGLVWFRRRNEVGHAALALACAAFAVHTASLWVIEPPVAATQWDAWLLLTALAAAGATLALATRLVDAPLTRRARIGLLIVVAVASAAGGSGAGSGTWLPMAQQFAALLLTAAGGWLAAHGWRRGDGVLFAPGLVLCVAGLADALQPAGTPPALPWALALLFGSAAWRLLIRFVETLNAAELLNVDLEALVQSRTAELRAQFERVAELERRQTVATERERLMRDMHDGVGGQLVSLLAMIEGERRPPQELATAVRDALDDMRLVIDSLEPVDDDLNAVLAMWRDRLEPRLRRIGVAVVWDVALLPRLPGLTPARVLHVLRILQEALTNAVRHGRAGSVRVAAQVAAGAVHITLADDGAGFDPAHAPRGRGLANMQRRAELAGAALVIDAAQGRGTTIALRLPLGGVDEAPRGGADEGRRAGA